MDGAISDRRYFHGDLLHGRHCVAGDYDRAAIAVVGEDESMLTARTVGAFYPPQFTSPTRIPLCSKYCRTAGLPVLGVRVTHRGCNSTLANAREQAFSGNGAAADPDG